MVAVRFATFQATRRLTLVLHLIICSCVCVTPRGTEALTLEFSRGREGIASGTNVVLLCKESTEDVPDGLLPPCYGKTFRWYKDGVELRPSLFVPKGRLSATPDCGAAAYSQKMIVYNTAAQFEASENCVSKLLIRQVSNRDAGSYSCSVKKNWTLMSNSANVQVVPSVILPGGTNEVQIVEQHNDLSHLSAICDYANHYPHAKIEDEEYYYRRAFTEFVISMNDSRLFDSNNVSLANDAYLVAWDTMTLYKLNQHLHSFDTQYPVTRLRFRMEIMYFCNPAEVYVSLNLNHLHKSSIVFGRSLYRWPVNCSDYTEANALQEVSNTANSTSFDLSTLTIVMYVALACFAATCVIAGFVLWSVKRINKNMQLMRSAGNIKLANGSTMNGRAPNFRHHSLQLSLSADTAIPLLNLQSGHV